jgi:predicted transglutaminase-like cysteine proteinase
MKLFSFAQSLQSRRLGEMLVSSRQLSPEALRQALAIQKTESGRLGAILVRHGLIGRGRLYRYLARQCALRVLATILTTVIAWSSIGVKSAHAGSLPDVATEISLASNNGSVSPSMPNAPGLFGSEERSSSNIDPFWKWTGMYKRFESQIHDPRYATTLARWRASLQPLAHLPLKEMAQGVDDMMNAHPYIHDDFRRFGVSDYWETPLEFITQSGDCKDYAIAKYASLRLLGVPENRLRIAVVQDIAKNEPHAILILYTNDDTLVLDNQNTRVMSSADVSAYRPIFSINRTGWWLDTPADGTELASAQ